MWLGRSRGVVVEGWVDVRFTSFLRELRRRRRGVREVGWGALQGRLGFLLELYDLFVKEASVIASKQVSIRGKGLSCTKSFEFRSR